ncbi:tetratricopeptide repeat protein [Pseudonocardia sp. T1-2H]|uniref:tetratricopeptide repeat protein n=1 Tax=Pseudonocardia sp. T1-2H TaxID=3128899 RepID=UPI003100F155
MTRERSHADPIHGHANDESHLYQQNSGIQLNIDEAYFGDDGLASRLRLPGVTWNPDDWPTVAEWDPLDLGVHRAPINDGNAVPLYVQRDVDTNLGESITHAAENGGMVIVIGDSTAGKTRSSYQALRSRMPQRRLYRPEAVSEFRASVVSLLAFGGSWVIWLDDLERFIGPSGITPGILLQLKRAKIACVATIRSEQYRRFEDVPGDTDEHAISEFRRIVDQSRTILLPRRWSEAELARAGSSTDPRIREAISHGQLFGVAEYLAAGPLLREIWETAWGAGANPRGASLVAAAVDCSRAGVDVPLPSEFLRSLHEFYLERAGGEILAPETFVEARAWATRRRMGVASLLIPSDNGEKLRAFEYLQDSISREEGYSAVPSEVWKSVVDFAGQDVGLLFGIAYSAKNHGLIDVEIDCWRKISEFTHSPRDLTSLGRVLLRASRDDEALGLFESAAASGDIESNTQLGIYLQNAERQNEAKEFLLLSAEAGDAHAALHLAILLRDQNSLEDAEKWYRKAHEANRDTDTSTGLASVLADRGLDEEADRLFESIIREASDSDDLNGIGIAADKAGRHQIAAEMWDRAIELGDGNAAANRAQQLDEAGDVAGADALWAKSIQLGCAAALLGHARLLWRTGQVEEAEAKYISALALDVEGAELCYSTDLYNSGRFDDAEKYLRVALEKDPDNAPAAYNMAFLLERRGADKLESEQWLVRAAQNGSIHASARLGERLFERGQFHEARRHLLVAAEDGDEVAACHLGTVLARLEDWEESNKWFNASYDSGHFHAGCVHGSSLLMQGSIDEAIQRFILAARGGHMHAAEVLEKLFRDIGNFKDAAYWHGFRSGRNQISKPNKKQSKKSRRRRR